MDTVHIDELRLRCFIGVTAEERSERQEVVFFITMYADLHRAGKTDNIDDTVNYKQVKADVWHFVESSRFQLIEALADGVARVCLEDDHVQEVHVRVEKPGALRFTRTAAVEITRTPSDFVE